MSAFYIKILFFVLNYYKEQKNLHPVAFSVTVMSGHKRIACSYLLFLQPESNSCVWSHSHYYGRYFSYHL
jgi:hypothetical protein